MISLSGRRHPGGRPQVNIQYAVLQQDGHPPELVEKLYFDCLLDFVYMELMWGLQKGYVPKRCTICGWRVLQLPGTIYTYYDGPAPGQEDRICREMGASANFQEKVYNNEIWKLHQWAYKKHFARTRKDAMSNPDFEVWTRESEQLRDEALTSYENAGGTEPYASGIEVGAKQNVGYNVF